MIVGSLLLILVAVALLVLGLAVGSSGLLVGSIVASLLAALALIVGARQDAAGRADEAFDDEPEEMPEATPGREDVAGVPESRYAMAGSRAGRTDQWGGRYGDRTPPADPAATAAPPVQAPPLGGYGSPPRGDTGLYGQRRTPDWSDTAGDGADTFVGSRSDGGHVPAGGLGGPGSGTGSAGAPTGGTSADGFDEDPPDEPAPQVVSPAAVARIARMATDVLVIDGRPRYHLPGCVHLLGRDSEPLPVGEAVELGFTPCSLCEPDNALLADPHQG